MGTDLLAAPFALHSYLGQRLVQEDSCRLLCLTQRAGDEPAYLAVVADGMGGYLGGALASNCVSDCFVQHFLSAVGTVYQRMQKALEQASCCLAELDVGAVKGMGTTLLAVYLEEGQMSWLSVGDSPLWLIRDGGLRRLNQDHSMVPVFHSMVEMGEMSQAAAESDSKRHVLRSVITAKPASVRLLDQPEEVFSLQQGDQLLLASDGVEVVAGTQIVDTVLAGGLATLFDAIYALDKPDQDNASAILFTYQADKRTVDELDAAHLTHAKQAADAEQGLTEWLLIAGLAVICTGLYWLA